MFRSTQLGRNALTLETGSAQLAGGVVSATGEYDFGTRRAHVQLQSTPLNLGQLADSYTTDVSIAGTIDGKASVELQGSEIQSATGKGRLVAVSIEEPF